MQKAVHTMAVRVADAKKPVAADATKTARRGAGAAAKRAAARDTWTAAARARTRRVAANRIVEMQVLVRKRIGRCFGSEGTRYAQRLPGRQQRAASLEGGGVYTQYTRGRWNSVEWTVFGTGWKIDYPKPEQL